MGVGVRVLKKGCPLFFLVEKHESLGVFDFDLKKCFRIPTSWGSYGAEWDER